MGVLSDPRDASLSSVVSSGLSGSGSSVTPLNTVGSPSGSQLLASLDGSSPPLSRLVVTSGGLSALSSDALAALSSRVRSGGLVTAVLVLQSGNVTVAQAAAWVSSMTGVAVAQASVTLGSALPPSSAAVLSPSTADAAFVSQVLASYQSRAVSVSGGGVVAAETPAGSGGARLPSALMFAVVGASPSAQLLVIGVTPGGECVTTCCRRGGRRGCDGASSGAPRGGSA